MIINWQMLYAVFRPLFVENCSTGQGIGMLYTIYSLGRSYSVPQKNDFSVERL